jgi:hypothetical protein
VGTTTGKVSEETEEAVSPASVCEVEVEKENVKPCLDDADSISWTTWLINGEEGPHSPNPPFIFSSYSHPIALHSNSEQREFGQREEPVGPGGDGAR